MMKPPLQLAIMLFALSVSAALAAEWHVATTGNDDHPGSAAAPFRTIQKAADVAQPGDVITVHEGLYRERINPPRGGESDARRIVYQAAPGEKVEIRGSEVVRGWRRVEEDVWTVTLPNHFFGSFNPFREVICGNWFYPESRVHHRGAVYLNGEWLVEAPNLESVFAPESALTGKASSLLSLGWLRPLRETPAESIRATAATERQGTRDSSSPEGGGGDYVADIAHGNWLRYEVDFGKTTTRLELHGASATRGAMVELHMDSPSGQKIGTCRMLPTGGWQKWSTFTAEFHPVSGRRTLYLVFKDPGSEREKGPLWYGKVDETTTTIWAQFKGIDPNTQLVEVNARPTVFYPDKPGRNYITVRGFIMRHAATNWAPPTAEQVGLIGTNWSKGWIIENNIISHSVCTGVTLGKYGDKFDNKGGSAEGYVGTIKRALEYSIPWDKEHVGHYIVRNNTISNCEQAGIVGSLGAIFSKITGNTIHDIWVRRLWKGAEQAGIKFHAAIDVQISQNHIYQSPGIWLDWMAQGTRVSRNLLHDNSPRDLFVEVNHGPFIVDNNLFLTRGEAGSCLLDLSEGGAYLHNLFAGTIVCYPDSRETPYHPAHATALAGLKSITGGDNRFFNNIFVGDGNRPKPAAPKEDSRRIRTGYGLWVYDERELPTLTGGNVYLNGARPYAKEIDPVVLVDWCPDLRAVKQAGRTQLHLSLPEQVEKTKATLVTTELLGNARISGLPYVDTNGSLLSVDLDYFGKSRSRSNPRPGPFEVPDRADGSVIDLSNQ